MSTGKSLGANRNSAGATNVVLFLIGIAALFAGIYVSTIVQINLLTNQTSFPYLKAGVPLSIGGVVLMVVARAAAKQKLVK